MASTSSSYRQNAFSGIEPPNKRSKVEQSSRLFDVFINHRGTDVKQAVSIQLYKSLEQLGIRTFLDSEEKELGTSFSSTVETAINSASVHIAIFSKGYAHSAWCLAELVLMLQTKAMIIPLFYQVEPWELRHIEKGVYAEAFLKYVEKGRYLDKINEWKEALQLVSCILGYEFSDSDSCDCKEIVSAVEKEVRRTKYLLVAKHPVGLHKLVTDFERRCLHNLVQDFESNCGMNRTGKTIPNVFGIFGMGGVGKTTLSKELFNKNRSQYSRASFLFDVREASARAELPNLQSKMLKDLFCEDHRFRSTEEGTSCLRDRLERSGSLSFLIVLDDIDHVEQFDALIALDILNNSGNNMVIVTTRDVGVLVTAGIEIAYHLKGLDREDGKELFCWHAFRQPHPCSAVYEDLVEKFVNACGGLPLSLQVLGRHVYGKDLRYWRAELNKVSRTLPGDLKERLKISFDSLDNEQKQIFIDVACFFIDKSKTMAMTIWEGSGWSSHHALETLKDKCLVEEVKVKYVDCLGSTWEPSAAGPALRMHDHLRDLGREMANELSHPRRVWHPKHLKSLESKGFRNILAQTKGRLFHSIFDKSIGCGITYFLGDTEDGSDTFPLWLQLEYLNCRPLDQMSDINSCIPSWIPLQYLQCLRISNGRFRKLWQSDVQGPSHLKELQIRDTFLEEIPDLRGKLNYMEKLVLHAKYIKTDIWSLLESLGMYLRSLKMMGSAITGDLGYNDSAEGTTFKSLVIYDLKQLWEGKLALENKGWSVMSDVENLEINGYRLVTKILITGICCQRLQSLKICEMENLIETALVSIKTLNRLEITRCENFKRLSATTDLCKLVELKISGCLELEELRLGHLSCLVKITLENCNNLKSVSGISNLAKIVEMKISDCGKLDVKYLCLSGMKSLERITFERNVKGTYLELDDCQNLKTMKFGCEELVVLSIRGCPELEVLSVVFGSPSRLERIILDGCENLKYLELISCQRLKSVSGNFQLRRLCIIDCPELELPSAATLRCLDQIEIDFCERQWNIMLPSTITSLSVRRCRGLQRTAGIGDFIKVRMLVISECPELEELRSLATMRCLDEIEIESCEMLQKIMLPTTITSFSVRRCSGLQRVAGAGDFLNVRKLVISECPELEELPSPATMRCLDQIEIDSCERLQNIILPTTLIGLDVQSCMRLQRVAGADDLIKLTRLIIKQCPKLEELPSLSRVSCLEQIEIDSCEKLQNITLPTITTSLSVRCCRDLRRVAGTGDPAKLRMAIISECPNLEELSILSRRSGLKIIEIDSCEKLRSITLPTTVTSLSVRCCRDLQRVEGTDDLMELVEFEFSDCGKLEFENLWEDKEHAPLQLKELIITGTWSASFERFPSSISYLINLRKIALLGNAVKQFGIRGLPEEFCDLQSLEHLELRHCTLLSSLPEQFGGLRNLRHLDLCSCKALRMLPVSFQQLKHLKHLDLSGCKRLVLQEDTLGDITQLENLYLSGCLALKKIPDNITGQSCLRELQLQYTSLEDLPKNIGQLSKLEVLTIGSPLMKSLPDSLGNLSSLKSLSITDCFALESLPKTLGDLGVLEHLCIESSGVKSLPEGFRHLANLRTLKISDCQLSELDFGSLSSVSLEKLTEINLCATLVTRISISDQCCPRLETLRLSKNDSLEVIESLPATVNDIELSECETLKNIKGILALPTPPSLRTSYCPELEES